MDFQLVDKLQNFKVGIIHFIFTVFFFNVFECIMGKNEKLQKHIAGRSYAKLYQKEGRCA